MLCAGFQSRNFALLIFAVKKKKAKDRTAEQRAVKLSVIASSSRAVFKLAKCAGSGLVVPYSSHKREIACLIPGWAH
jgi:hypothetical protein